MIGERKGSKILSCTHAGRVITLVPVAEVFPWHLDPLFIMRQITHGVVSAAWQEPAPPPMFPSLTAPGEDKYDVRVPWTFNEQTYLGDPENIMPFMFGVKNPNRRRGLRGDGWYLRSIFKDWSVDFHHYLALSHQPIVVPPGYYSLSALW